MSQIDQAPDQVLAPEPKRVGTDAIPVHEGGPNPLWQLVLARVREFLREPEAVFWVYVFPLVMAVALGIAFRNPAKIVVIVDFQKGAGAELAAEALRPSSSIGQPTNDRATPSTEFEVTVSTEEEARRRLRTGRTQLVVIAKVKDEAAAENLDSFDFEYLYDPTRQESVLARAAVDDALQRAAGRRDSIQVEDVTFAEPGGRYIDFLIPGLLGASLLGGGLWGMGFVTVNMRVRNLLKRFVTTPMKKSHFLLGLMISRFLFMVTEVLVLLVFAWLVFDVAVMGSWAVLVFLIVLGALTFSGVGLLVGCRAKTLETASGLMNLVMLPMWLLSGIFFSSEHFPDVVQPAIKLLPLTPLITALRAVMIEGLSLAALVPEIMILAAWAVVSFFLALRWFRWY